MRRLCWGWSPQEAAGKAVAGKNEIFFIASRLQQLEEYKTLNLNWEFVIKYHRVIESPSEEKIAEFKYGIWKYLRPQVTTKGNKI